MAQRADHAARKSSPGDPYATLGSMCPSAPSSFPHPDACHPHSRWRAHRHAAQSAHGAAASPRTLPPAPSAPYPSSAPAPRSHHEIDQRSSAHVLPLDCAPASSDAPATPPRGPRVLAKSAILRDARSLQHQYHHQYHHHHHHHHHQHQHQHHQHHLAIVAYRAHDAASPASAMPMPASPTALASLPPSAHPKITRLPALDMELDRLARACGQGPTLADLASSSPSRLHAGPSHPSYAAHPSHPSYSSHPSHAAHPSHPSHPSHAAHPPRPTHLATPHASRAAHPPDDAPALDDPFAQAWGLRPRATSVRVPQRPPSTMPAAAPPLRPRSTSQPASIPAFAPPGPRGVLRALRGLLQREGRGLDDCLDVRAVLARWEGRGETAHHKTFGAPVALAVRCAAMSTVLGGYQHDVPWVVYACVEELNRTGIYQPGLFRSVPNRTRLARLIESFDMCTPACASSPDTDGGCPSMAPTLSTTRASLRKETMPDVCALLKTYLDLLPSPLLDENIAAAFHLLCVQPTLARDAEADPDGSDSDGGYFASHARARSAPPPRTTTRAPHPPPTVPMTPSEAHTLHLALEAPQITLAQHLLRLAPPPPLALLAYLLAFFTQLPLCPDNGMSLADVARMFAHVLVGGAVRARARECAQWLLERWQRISDGLFDPVEDEQGARAYADSAPATACKRTFDAWPPHPPVSLCVPQGSRDGAPREMQQQGVQKHARDGVGEADVGSSGCAPLMPYDPGLGEHACRPHSTSVSSTSSSATTASVESDAYDSDDAYHLPGGDGAHEVEVEVEVEVATRELDSESGSVYDSLDLDRRAHISPNFRLGLEREYASCPPSPRHFARYTPAANIRCSSPASIRSLDAAPVRSRDVTSSGSTSRCSPPPPPPPLPPRSGGRRRASSSRDHSPDSEFGCESGAECGDGTPRNSASERSLGGR